MLLCLWQVETRPLGTCNAPKPPNYGPKEGQIRGIWGYRLGGHLWGGIWGYCVATAHRRVVVGSRIYP